MTNPLEMGKIRADKSQQFIGEKCTAVINIEIGKLGTAWSTSLNKAKKLKERSDKK